MLYIPFAFLQKIFSVENINFFTLAIVFYSALTNSVIFLLLKKLFNNARAALLISALIAIGSMIWPYANIGMEYQATLFLALTLFALVCYEQSGKGLIWVGLSLGLLTTAKSYDILLFIPAAAYVLWILKQKGQIKKIFNFAFLAAFFLPTFLLFGLTALGNWLVYKSFAGTYSLSAEFQITAWWEGFYGLFFSIGKSMFTFNPLLIITVLFWPKFLKEHKKPAYFILLNLFLLLIVNAPLIYWTDETWGPRKLLPIIPLLHLPLICLLPQLKKKLLAMVFVIFVAGAAYVQFLGAAYFYGTQLKFLKENNFNVINGTRYVPELAHPVLYNKFFISYLNRLIMGTGKNFNYYEDDWFKWEGGVPFKLFPKTPISLRKYEKPFMLWLRETENYNSGQIAAKKKLFLAIDAIIVLSLFYSIIRLYQKRPE